MAVEIRAATPEDARAIAWVHVASWRWAYRDLLPADVLASLSVEGREEMWRSLLSATDPRSFAIVATDDGAVVGFTSAGPSRDVEGPPPTAEIFTLYLVEHVVGRGIGRRLFSELLDRIRAHRYERATLWVLAANERARRFYEAAGWRPDGAEDVYDVGGVGYPEVRYATDL